MDRRAFLRAIVAMPVAVVVAKAAFVALPQPFRVRRFIDYRVNYHAWQVYYTTPIGADEYFTAELISGDKHVPLTAYQLARSDKIAWHSFNRAQKRIAAGETIPPDHEA